MACGRLIDRLCNRSARPVGMTRSSRLHTWAVSQTFFFNRLDPNRRGGNLNPSPPPIPPPSTETQRDEALPKRDF
jgi:hypothetical protein